MLRAFMRRLPVQVARVTIAAVLTVSLATSATAQVTGGEPPLEVVVNSTDLELGPSAQTAITSNGRFLALPQNSMLEVWDLTAAQLVRRHQIGEKSITAVAMLPDDRRVILADDDENIKVVDLQTGRIEREMSDPGSRSLRILLVTPDGRTALAAGYGNDVQVWDVETGALKGHLKGHTDSINSMHLATDGRFAATGSDDKSVRIWDVAALQLLQTIDARTEIAWVGISTGSKDVLAIGKDQTLKQWSVADGRLVRTVLTEKNGLDGALLSRDGSRLVLGSKRSSEPFEVFDARTGQPLKSLAGSGPPAVAKKGTSQADREMQRLLREQEATAPRYLSNSFLMPDGTTVATKGLGSLEFRSLATGEVRHTVEAGSVLGKKVDGFALSPSGQWLATVTETEYDDGKARNEVRLWDLAVGAPARSIASSIASFARARFSADGRHLALIDEQDSIHIHDATTGASVSVLRTKPESKAGKFDFSGKDWRIEDIALAPDMQHVLAWHTKTVRIYETKSGKLLRTLQGIGGDVAGIVISPDSTLALVAEDKAVRLFDLKTGRVVGALGGASGAADGVFLPDGRRVVIRSGDDFNIFETATGTFVLTFKQENVNCWGIGPDGTILIASRTSISEVDSVVGRPKVVADGTGFVRYSWGTSCRISAAGRRLVGNDPAGGLAVRSAATGALQLRLFDGKGDAFLAETPAGALAGRGEALKAVHVVRGLELQDPALVEREFVRPDLVTAALTGDTDGLYAAFAKQRGVAALAGLGTPNKQATARFLGSPVPPIAIKPLAPIGKARIVANQAHRSTVEAVALSGDGRLLVSVGGDEVAKLWDVATGRLIRTFEGSGKNLTVVVLAPDGSRVVAGDRDGRLTVWDVESGRLVKAFKAHEKAIDAVAWSPDGRWLVAAASDPKDDTALSNVYVFDADTLQKVRERTEKGYGVKSLGFLRDARHLVIAHSKLVIWDVVSGDVRRNYDGGGAASLSVDGETIAVDQHRSVSLYDVHGGLIRSMQEHGQYVYNATFSLDGKFIYARDSNNAIVSWDVASGRKTSVTARVSKDDDWGKIGALLPGGEQYITLWGNDIAVRDLRTGAKLRSIGEPVHPATSIALLPNPSQILVASGPKPVVWDIANAARIRSFEPTKDKDWTGAIKLSADAKRVMVGYPRRLVRLLDPASGRELAVMRDTLRALTPREQQMQNDSMLKAISQMQVDIDSRAYAFDMSPDGRQVALGRNDGTIKFYDANSGALQNTVTKAHDSFISAIAYSPDGRHLASGGADRLLRIWDARTGKAVRSHEGHRWTIRAMAFLPDGRRLVTGSGDLDIIVWDFDAGRPLLKFKAHDGVVRSLAISRDGELIASGSTDATVKLWRATSGELVHTFGGANGHIAEVDAVAITADRRHLISASTDGATKIWSIETGELLANFISVDSGEWLMITPEGFFSASRNGAEILSVIHGSEVIGIDRFFDSLNRPDLVRDKLADTLEGRRRVREAAARVDLDKILASGLPPKVAITSHAQVATSSRDRVAVEADVTDRGGGIGRIEWRLNGLLIGVEAPAERGTAFARQVVQLAPGENRIEVTAYNERGLVTSEPVETILRYSGPAIDSKPRLFVVAVGVNDYFDAKLKLRLAVNDARKIADGLKQAGRDIYEDVQIRVLLDKDGTAEVLDRTFAELALVVRPNDVFVFFAAGHGVTQDGRYYFLPQDFRASNDEALAKFAIGQDRLQSWFAKMPEKSILMFDTCESGTMTHTTTASLVTGRTATRGNEHITAVQRLNRATGRVTITAAMDDQEAREGHFDHGVFTFAVLDALARGDRNGNGRIEVTELIDYIDAAVPEITEKRWGVAQIPRSSFQGSNYSLGWQVPALAPAPAEQVIVSTRPTHVLLQESDIRRAATADGEVLERLAPGTLLTLVKTEAGWTLVAREGRPIGYIVSERLLKVQ